MSPLTFTQALERAELLARQALPPASHERLSCAVALVKDGHVLHQAPCHVVEGGRLLRSEPGHWTVESVQTPGKTYTVNGACDCADTHFNKPPWCKHQLAVYVARKVQALMHASALPADPEPVPDQVDHDHLETQPLYEAPVSITMKASVYGFETLVTLRGTDFASVQAQVEQAAQWLKAQGPAPAPQAASPGEGYCPVHRVQMKLHTNAKGTWYSHFVDGAHCKGR
jgi:hypothetical protein